MDKKTQAHAWYVILAILGILLIQAWWVGRQQIEVIPYSQFRELVRSDKVESVDVEGPIIYGRLKAPLPDGRQMFRTTQVVEDLAKDLEQHGVKFTGVVPDTFLSGLLSWILPILVFFAIWYFGFRRLADRFGGGGLMSVGRSRAKIYVETDTKTTFDDVAGADEAKEELREVVGFLKDPGRYSRLGGRIPKGVLLVGPPGTGKTLLARAVAGEAGVPFFSISGSEFVEMFVGVGAARVRDLFVQARQKAPAIIFIDELDALGRARGAAGSFGANDEKEQTLNQLLTEMDGFDTSKGLVLLGATNRPEVLDPALLRAGRFDRQVLVDRPDKAERAAILRLHVRRVKLAPEVDIDQLAELTPGFTGADLANLVNEAALTATRRGADAIGQGDFTAAFERIVAGLEKRNRVLNRHEREVVAHHEMGHALVALLLPRGGERVHKVSIIPRGIGALGYTIRRPTEERFLMTRGELEDKMAVLLGGRAAEQLVFGEVSTGAADDLQKVTDIARDMVARYGMTEELGNVVYERDRTGFLEGPVTPFARERSYGQATADRIDVLVRQFVDGMLERTVALLSSRRETLERGAAELLRRETLTEAELTALVGLPSRQQPGAAAA
jgi:cell division protease FtsH